MNLDATARTAPSSPLRSRLDRAGFVRSAEDRVLTGALGGFGRAHGIDPLILRAAAFVLALVGGFGIVAYAALVLAGSRPHPAHLPRRPVRRGLRPVFAVGLIVWGTLVMLRTTGFWPGNALVWPAALAVLGALVLWTRSEGGREHRWGSVEALFRGPGMVVRIAIGAGLIVVGAGTFLAEINLLAVARAYAVPVVIATAGLTLIFGPWVYRLARELAEERRERIRSEERSEMAAHLHDSVLQTLALIQRSNEARSMASLARVQERELRAWLFGHVGLTQEDTLTGAIDAAAGRVEQMHKRNVETIVVGDAVVDESTRALVLACGEAMQNAAKHSGAEEISVYVEVEADQISAFVRDEGSGFDVGAIAEDRRGISESIRARMERVGGSAAIFSRAGEGTEVQVSLPRRKP